MKTRNLHLIWVCVIVGLFFGINLQAADQKKEVITLNEKGKKGPVTFKHVAHVKEFGRTCKDCHHGIKTDEEAQACSKCHSDKAEGKKVTLKDAFHTTCKDCHKKVTEEKKAKKEESKAATKCNDCHQKK